MKSLTINVELDGEVLGSRDTIAVHIDPLTLAQIYREGKQAEEDRLSDMVNVEILSASVDNPLGMVELGKPVHFCGVCVGFALEINGPTSFIALAHNLPDAFRTHSSVNILGKRMYKIKRELYLRYYEWCNSKQVHVKLPEHANVKPGTPVTMDGKVVGTLVSSEHTHGQRIDAKIEIKDQSALAKIFNDKPVPSVAVKQYKYELYCGGTRLGEFTSSWMTSFILSEVLDAAAPSLTFKEL